jgi:hypothetical protein
MGDSYLIRRQLEVVSLIWDQVAKFHGEHTSSIGDDQGKIPELEINVIGALEVIVHRNLLLGVGLSVLQLEDGVLGVGTLIVVSRSRLPSELLDRIDLVVCKMSVIVDEINEESTYHRPCLYA